MKKMIVAPSILSADFLRLGEQIATCEEAGADWIHVDVMDGHFVSNLTMGPVIVEACRRATRLPLDVHLMIEHPERLFEAFARAGADHLTVHIETCPDMSKTLNQILDLGLTPGIVLNPDTPVSAIEPFLERAGLVLVMSVHPGYSGQSFMPATVSKVADLRDKLDALGSPAWLEVDGGIAPDTLPLMQAAGADAFVAASAIFKDPQGIAAGIRSLRAAGN